MLSYMARPRLLGQVECYPTDTRSIPTYLCRHEPKKHACGLVLARAEKHIGNALTDDTALYTAMESEHEIEREEDPRRGGLQPGHCNERHFGYNCN